MAEDIGFPFEKLTQFWMEEVRPPIGKALEVVPDDKLDWAPAEGMITLGNIFMHIAEASDWWISEVIDQNGCTDYTPCPSVPKPEIAVMMDNHWKRLEAFFVRAPQVLEGVYDMSRYKRDRKPTGHWIFLHLLEHDIHHRSQINHYLRILGVKPPRI